MCPENEKVTVNENDKINVRYTPPSKYEEATWSTICKVMGEGEEYELYIQISMDPHQPEWIKMSNLLEQTFTDLLSDQEFINICLQMKTTPSNENYKRLGTLITKKSE